MDLLMILKITSVRLIEQIKKDTPYAGCMVVYDHVELKCREEVRQSLSTADPLGSLL